MLLIIRIDDLDDRGEVTTTQALPSKDWVEGHKPLLEHVLGEERFQALLVAVTAEKPKSFREEWTSSYYYDSNEYYTDLWGQKQPYDYTACGIECGYCGQCDY
jgi:hypothetical protein